MRIDETLVGALAFEIVVLAFFAGVLALLGAPLWGAVGLGFLISQFLIAESNRP